MTERRPEHDKTPATSPELLAWKGTLDDTLRASLQDVEWEDTDSRAGSRVLRKLGQLLFGKSQTRKTLREYRIPATYEYRYKPGSGSSLDAGGSLGQVEAHAILRLVVSELRVVPYLHSKAPSPSEVTATIAIEAVRSQLDLPPMPDDPLGRYIHRYGDWQLLPQAWMPLAPYSSELTATHVQYSSAQHADPQHAERFRNALFGSGVASDPGAERQ